MSAPHLAWEAFAVAHPNGDLSEVTSRQLDNSEGRYDWPDAEVHHGIAGVMIQTHGDDPRGAFIKVWGRSPAACEETLKRLASLIWSGAVFDVFPLRDGQP